MTQAFRWPPNEVMRELLKDGRDLWIADLLGARRDEVRAYRKALRIPSFDRGGSAPERTDGLARFLAKWGARFGKAPASIVERTVPEMPVEPKPESPSNQRGPLTTALTVGQLLADVRRYHKEHGRWPTVAELAADLDREERYIRDRVGVARLRGMADLQDRHIVPTDLGAASAGPVTTYHLSPEEIAERYGPPRPKDQADRIRAVAQHRLQKMGSTVNINPEAAQRETEAAAERYIMPDEWKARQEGQDDMPPHATREADEALVNEYDTSGLTYEQLAQKHGITTPAYRNRLDRARKRLNAARAGHQVYQEPKGPQFQCETCRDSGVRWVGDNEEPCTCAVGQRVAETLRTVRAEAKTTPADAAAPPALAPEAPTQRVAIPEQAEAHTSPTASETGNGGTNERFVECLCCEGKGGRGSIPCGECNGLGFVSEATKQAQAERLAAIKATKAKVAALTPSELAAAMSMDSGHQPTPGEVEAMLTEEPMAQTRSGVVNVAPSPAELGQTIRALEAENRDLRGQVASLEAALKEKGQNGDSDPPYCSDLERQRREGFAGMLITFDKGDDARRLELFQWAVARLQKLERDREMLNASNDQLRSNVGALSSLNHKLSKPLLLTLDGDTLRALPFTELPAPGDQYAEPVTVNGQRRYNLYRCHVAGEVEGRQIRFLTLEYSAQDGEAA